jgi:hypothetical protein
MRFAAAAVGVAAIMLVSACGAGQIAETSKIVPAVPGGSGSATIPDDPSQEGSIAGTVFVQNVTFDYNGPAGYPKGASAPLSIRIINNSGTNIQLTGVTASTVVDNARVDLGAVALGSNATPLPAASAPAPSGAPSAPGSPAPGGGSPSAAPSTPPAAPSALNVKIPANELVDLSQQGDQFIEVSNLTVPIKPGDVTTLVFTFTDITFPAGQIAPVNVQTQIGPPTAPATRSPINNAPTGD